MRTCRCYPSTSQIVFLEEGGNRLKNSNFWITWVVIAFLLVFAGIASAVVPLVMDEMQRDEGSAIQQDSGPVTTSVDVSQLPFVGEVLVEIPFIQENIQGRTISLLQAFAIAIGAVLVGTGAFAVPIVGVVILLSRQLDSVYADESYQEAAKKLSNREKEFVKQRAENQPSKSSEDVDSRSRNTTIIFGFIYVLLTWITTFTIATSLLEGGSTTLFGIDVGASEYALFFALLAAIILAVYYGRKGPMEIDDPDSEQKPVDWGTIWVIITGLVIVGVGAGIAVFFTTSG
jgi:hypothetical protein